MGQSAVKNSLGSLVARVLVGSWRDTAPPPDFSGAELTSVLPLLLASGAGALAWNRIARSTLANTPAGEELHAAYRMHALHSAIHETEIRELWKLFQAGNVEPVLVKGWAVARWYPEPCLRPYGDLDLCFSPEEYRVASSIVASPEAARFYVDLHRDFAKLDGESPRDLLARSNTVSSGDTEIRVLGFEDQLRILCTHFLRHGAWRPLWLCDIAVGIENRPRGFDWQQFLGDDRRHAEWVGCAVVLAHELLGARIDDTPVAGRAGKLPRWLSRHVLANWNAPFPENYPPMSYSRPLVTYLRHPAGLGQALRARWPDALEATIRLGGRIDRFPRLPYQIVNLLGRAARFGFTLGKPGGDPRR